MKWKEILLKSWDYIKKYRALWYLGILAALAGGGSGGSNFSSLNSSSNSSSTVQSSMNKVFDWISNNQAEVIVLVLALVLISLIILYISYSAQAGLIYSINKAESGGKKPEFHDSFHHGQKYFWRFIGITLLIALMALAVAFVLIGLIAICAVLVISVSAWFLIIIIPIGLLLILGIIFLAVYLSWILILAYRVIVIRDKKIGTAISEARELLHSNFTNIILAWLIQAAVGLAASIALVIVAMVVGAALLAIGAGIYFAGGLTTAIVYGCVAALIFIALTLLLSGIVSAYFSTYWTIIYRKLVAAN